MSTKPEPDAKECTNTIQTDVENKSDQKCRSKDVSDIETVKEEEETPLDPKPLDSIPLLKIVEVKSLATFPCLVTKPESDEKVESLKQEKNPTSKENEIESNSSQMINQIKMVPIDRLKKPKSPSPELGKRKSDPLTESAVTRMKKPYLELHTDSPHSSNSSPSQSPHSTPPPSSAAHSSNEMKPSGSSKRKSRLTERNTVEVNKIMGEQDLIEENHTESSLDNCEVELMKNVAFLRVVVNFILEKMDKPKIVFERNISTLADLIHQYNKD